MSDPRGLRAEQDAIVIGAGLAGLAAAVRLAESGARVIAVAKGVGATHLSPGTIDVLGYAPERVERPVEALETFTGDHPGHPYAVLGADAVGASVDWFKGCFANGYRYTGDLSENVLLPTAVGVAKPTAVVPETMAGGDLRNGLDALIVSFRTLKDFHPSYLADNLGRAEPGGPVTARGLSLDLRPEGRAEVNALALARAFEDPGFREQVAALVAPHLGGAERVGFPAALGMQEPREVVEDLERRLGRPVFEIPTLPPSVPGIRIFRALSERLRASGGRLVMNSPIVGFEAGGRRVTAVRAHASGHDVVYPARMIVLASGGFASGGLALDSRWQASDTVLGLPLAGVPGPDEPRFVPEYFASQPLARAGVAVDAALRPVGADGERVFDNVLVAGATLAGAEPWREKSGAGLSLASGHRAAQLIIEEAA